MLKVNYQLNEIKELTMPTFCFNIHTISAIIGLAWSNYTHYEVVFGMSGREFARNRVLKAKNQFVIGLLATQPAISRNFELNCATGISAPIVHSES